MPRPVDPLRDPRRAEARKLRAAGWSYKKIQQKLGGRYQTIAALCDGVRMGGTQVAPKPYATGLRWWNTRWYLPP